MAGVFLSYDRDDTDRARHFAHALEKAGHSVWWDLHVRGGAQFSKVIEEALKAADAVVVLWSKNAIESPWVRDEAAAGRDSGRLVPVTIDGTEPPLGFRQFQTLDLSRWKGRGNPDALKVLLGDIAAMAGAPSDPPAANQASRPPARKRAFALSRRQLLSLAGAAVLAVVFAAGVWLWSGRNNLPIVEVAAANGSAPSQALASDLFVKLGSLAQVGNGKWQLVDAASAPKRPDLIFRTADTGSASKPQANLVLLNGKDSSSLWSREFSFPAGGEADLRQQMSLTAGRVLGCILESRDQGGLTSDLQKTFLEACASLADISGYDLGPVNTQLRSIVNRVPRFKPAWTRLISAECTLISYSETRPSYEALKQKLKNDVATVRGIFPDLPELAIADLRLRDRVDYGRAIETLSAAAERAPDNALLQAELSDALLNVGRMNDAISKAGLAAQLDPLSSGGTTTYVMTLAHGGRVETARSELAKAEKLWAGTGSLQDVELAFNMRYGDPAIARKLDPEGYSTDAYYDARSDPSPANIAKLKAKIDAFRPKPVTANQVGWAIQALGEFGLVDDVYYWLGRIPDSQVADMTYLLFRPALDSVRQDRRFMPLAKRLGLLHYWQSSGQWPDFCSRPNLPYDCKAVAAKLG